MSWFSSHVYQPFKNTVNKSTGGIIGDDLWKVGESLSNPIANPFSLFKQASNLYKDTEYKLSGQAAMDEQEKLEKEQNNRNEKIREKAQTNREKAALYRNNNRLSASLDKERRLNAVAQAGIGTYGTGANSGSNTLGNNIKLGRSIK